MHSFNELTNEDEGQLEVMRLRTQRGEAKEEYLWNIDTLLECDTTEGNIFKEFVIILSIVQRRGD